MTQEELVTAITEKLKTDSTALRLILLTGVIASLSGMSQDQLEDIADTLKISDS